jgi:hypothetical protein
MPHPVYTEYSLNNTINIGWLKLFEVKSVDYVEKERESSYCYREGLVKPLVKSLSV